MYLYGFYLLLSAYLCLLTDTGYPPFISVSFPINEVGLHHEQRKIQLLVRSDRSLIAQVTGLQRSMDTKCFLCFNQGQGHIGKSVLFMNLFTFLSYKTVKWGKSMVEKPEGPRDRWFSCLFIASDQ